MQQIGHMGFGCDTFAKSKFYSRKYGLLIVLQHQCQYISHLAISAGATKHNVL